MENNPSYICTTFVEYGSLLRVPMLDVCIAFDMFFIFFIMFSFCFLYSYLYCFTAIYPNNTIISFTSIDHLCYMNKAGVGWTQCLHACSLFR